MTEALFKSAFPGVPFTPIFVVVGPPTKEAWPLASSGLPSTSAVALAAEVPV
jgi:hypothetical protein